MANKSLKTRQKIVVTAPPVKPRNPFAGLAKARSAGPHERSKSAERQAAKRALTKKLSGTDEDA